MGCSLAHLDVLAALDRLGHLLQLGHKVLAGLVNSLLHGDGVGAGSHDLRR